MHNAVTRVQNVFGFFTTVAAVLAAIIAAVSLLHTPSPRESSVELRNVQVTTGRPHYHGQKEEFAHIRFDMDIDFTDLFTWNTKQLFVYITATYPSTNPTVPPSRIIIWDAILPHPLAPKHHNQYIYPGTPKKTKSKSKKTPQLPLPTPGLLKLTNQRPKYQLTDPSGRIASRRDAKLELHWNVQPFVGALTWGSASIVAAAVGGGTGITVKEYAYRPEWLPALLKSVATWRLSPGGVSKAFDFPAVKNRTEANRAIGGDGLDVARGVEGNRGAPS